MTMYCRTCGTDNTELNNYCWWDGTVLENEAPSLKFVQSETRFCSGCGHPIEEAGQYCPHCGTALFHYEASAVASLNKETPFKSDERAKFKLQAFSTGFIKKAIIPAVLAFIIMLALSGITAFITRTSYQDLSAILQSDELEDLLGQTDISKHPFIFNYQNTVMSAHAAHPVFSVEGEGSGVASGSIEFAYAFNFWLLLLIPIISTFAAGVFYQRKHGTATVAEKLYPALAIGVFYTVLAVILSLFCRNTYEPVAGAAVKFHLHYAVFGLIVASLIIGCLFSLLGMLFAIDYRHMLKHLAREIPFGAEICEAVRTFAFGLGAVTIISIIVVAVKIHKWLGQLEMEIPHFHFSVGKILYTDILAGSQMGSYVLGLLHFAPLQYKLGTEGQHTVSYSLLGGLKGTGDYGGLTMLLTGAHDFSVWLWIAAIIPIGLLIYAGWRLMKMNGILSYRSIAVLSLVYSLCLFMLMLVVRFSAEGTSLASYQFSFGLSPLRVFISSYILSFASVLVGRAIYLYRAC